MRVATMPMQGWLATPTRRNALKGIFIAPALFMLGVAVQSRPNYLDLDDMIGDKDSEARITNYVPVVREVESILTTRKVDRSRLRQVAHIWIEKEEKGELQPLPQLAPDDGIQNGVKGQILSAARELGRNLMLAGEAEAVKGNYSQSAEDLIAGLKVLEAVKYSDLASIAIVGNTQRRLLTRLGTVTRKLPEGERAHVRAELEAVIPDPKMLHTTARNDKRVAFVAHTQALEMARATGKPYDASLDLNRDISLLFRLAEHSDQENTAIIGRIK